MAHTVSMIGFTVATTVGTVEALIFTDNDFHTKLENDLDNVFFNVAEFSTPVIYNHYNGQTITYRGIFDEPYYEVNNPETGGIAQTKEIRLAEHNLKHSVRRGDTLRLKGSDYRVYDSQSDGVGVSTLYLEKI